MSTAETKRRGRPARAADEAVVDPVESIDDAPEVVKPPTPPCPRCGAPLDRSTKLLRAYDMVVLRCTPCRRTAIEGDVWYDTETIRAGKPPLLASRAAALFSLKHGRDPLPAFDAHGLDAAISSDWDDPRWTEVTG